MAETAVAFADAPPVPPSPPVLVATAEPDGPDQILAAIAGSGAAMSVLDSAACVISTGPVRTLGDLVREAVKER